MSNKNKTVEVNNEVTELVMVGDTEESMEKLWGDLDSQVPKDMPPIILAVPHDFALVKIALEDRVTVVKSLANKAEAEGYIREARIMAGDAARLKEDILPQLEHQRELPLATAEELQAGIKNKLRSVVRRHAKPAEENTDHEAELLEELAYRIEAMVMQVAERSFNAGVQLRQSEGRVIGLKCLDGLDWKAKAEGGQ